MHKTKLLFLLLTDETLYPTRMKMGFRHFNKDKPSRYGVLIQSVNSVSVPYTHSMIVSAGKPQNGTGNPFFHYVQGGSKKNDPPKALVL